MQPSSLQSESWHRLADQRLALRPDVRLRRQYFRGELWHVLEDPLTNQFFRLPAAAYRFVARLRPDRSVQQAWEGCVRAHPESAPTQEEALRLLAQLHQANLLQTELPPDSARLFERIRQRQQRQWQARLLTLMFARIPLLDPDRFLQRCLPWVRWLFGPWGLALWCVTVGGAVKVALDNAAALQQQTDGILAPNNLLLLYLGFALLKIAHEFGHAFLCRHFGGEVHTMGVMFMIFTPVPYVDATSAWRFRSRAQRLWVGAGGMLVELFVAALMTFLWASTAPGTLHSLAFNMMFVASVSTVLFNANPLMRFDGYYLLSDLLDIPNLYTRANQQLGWLVERYAFGLRTAESPARSRQEAIWLTLYGIGGHLYRVVVFAGILLFVGKRFLLLGVLMATVCLVGWVIVPVVKFFRYLLASPRLDRCRGRAVAVAVFSLGLGGFLLAGVPFPNHFRAPGVARAARYSMVANESAGWLAAVLAPPGAFVEPGQPLVRLENRELELEARLVRAQLDETHAWERRALQQQTADLRPLAARLQALAQRLSRIEAELATLTVRAPHAGIWMAPELQEATGRWLPRGSTLGMVIDQRQFCFEAVVSQRDATRLFADSLPPAEVRLRGQAGHRLRVKHPRVVPADQQQLPSAALGWRGGGEVPVRLEDPTGRQAAEPFFLVRAELESDPRVTLAHGRSGQIRFHLPPEPLFKQWSRRLHQLLQKEYGW